MATTGTQLIGEVALRMDEITPGSALSNITIDAGDGNPLYSLIEGVINDAALELYSAAPYWRLPVAPFNDKAVEAIPSDNSKMYIRIKVPADFLRLVEIDCADFQRPIAEVYPKQSVEGKRQYNKHLRAGVARPVAVMSSGLWSNTPAKEIQCYSLPSDTTVQASAVEASYIAKPAKIENNSTAVTIPDALLPALEWLAAARAFGARGDNAHAAICQQNAQNLLV